MKFSSLPLEGAWIIEPDPHEDDRGVFTRVFCKEEFQAIGFNQNIVQINCSITVKKGVVRGMHYQIPPKTESKIVRCMRGSVYDVVIDLRQGSPSFLQWHAEVISEKDMKMMYVPPGFAHGFQTLSENSELLYLHTEFYSPKHEGAVHYNDPKVKIVWPLPVLDTSEKDQKHRILADNFVGIKI